MSYYSSILPSPSHDDVGGMGSSTTEANAPTPTRRRRASSITSHDRSSELDLDHVVSQGAFGIIYRARYKSTGAIVAAKIAPLNDTVRNEIHFLSRCNCPYVVAYFGSFVVGDKMWVITDYCGGGFVHELFAKKRGEGRSIPEECIRAVAAGTLLALEYLHSVHVCHRDVRCSSVLLTNAGGVKLTSFGLSAELDEATGKRRSMVGSSLFMPPEVIKASAYDGKRDVWSLGVTVIEMADGAPPHSDLEQGRALDVIASGPPPRLADSDRWTMMMNEFVETCCVKGVGGRTDSSALTSHPWVQGECARGRMGAALFPWESLR